MISCLLIHVTRNPQGVVVREEGVISGETLRIGRGAACDIHLSDHRVSLLHASVGRGEDGVLNIEGLGDATLNIDGFVAQRGALLPGTVIVIGPYTLCVEAVPDGHDIALSIERLPHQERPLPAATPHTLDALGFSKRKLGLLLAACILLTFLLLPMLPGMSVALDDWQADLPVTLNGSWSPGPLAGGHALFESRCSVCHKQPFQAIDDTVCTGCHKQGAHLGNGVLQAKVFGGMRCTDCHADHKGRERLRHDDARCVSCHGDIRQRYADTTLGDVRDFADSHPAFHLTLPDGAGRVRQADTPVERSGLKYSHKVHLDKEGVSSPQGDIVMRCQDCHKLEASGRNFAPMKMEKTCQQSGCHRLDFTEPAEGRVPHGSVAAVMDRLREFYVKRLSDNPAERASCANARAAGDPVRRTLDCASDLARRNAEASLFRKDVECGECHEFVPSVDQALPVKIAPVHINRDWMPGASFVHARHETMDCTVCHDKKASQTSADIAMPGIGKCRECHAGKHVAKGRVVTACDSCHQFHRGEKK